MTPAGIGLFPVRYSAATRIHERHHRGGQRLELERILLAGLVPFAIRPEAPIDIKKFVRDGNPGRDGGFAREEQAISVFGPDALSGWFRK